MTSMLDELDSMSEEKHMEICHKADELQKKNLGEEEEMNEYEVGEIPPEELEKQKKRPYLSDEEKAIADKAAKLIARDYGEVIKKLENE